MEPTRTVIALLRGINVGGRNRLAMADLRSMADNLGFSGAATYLQSGNLILPNVAAERVDFAAALTDEIRRVCGLEVPVITRKASEWARVVADNPFPEATVDATKLHVVFLDGPATYAVHRFDGADYRPEELAVTESEIYLSLPNGMGRSKLAAALARVDNASAGTTRNWKTVSALAELATRS